MDFSKPRLVEHSNRIVKVRMMLTEWWEEEEKKIYNREFYETQLRRLKAFI